jgi:hypothetical protein
MPLLQTRDEASWPRGHPDQGARPTRHLPVTVPVPFFMKFRGPMAHPTRRHKPIVCPTVGLFNIDTNRLAVQTS